MKPSPQNSIDPESASGAVSDAAANTVDATLRLIANLPAPEGLAERVQAGLRAEMLSVPRRARLLQWPSALRPGHGLMRSAAAAAIVAVVAGGGWSVYSRVQPIQRARTVTMPHRPAAGGFSSAGAMRTPQTLNGPVAPPLMPQEAQAAKVVEQSRPAAASTKASSAASKAASRKLAAREVSAAK